MHFLMSTGNVVLIYGTTYSTAISAVNNNSVYETKTISGDKVKRKQTTTKKV